MSYFFLLSLLKSFITIKCLCVWLRLSHHCALPCDGFVPNVFAAGGFSWATSLFLDIFSSFIIDSHILNHESLLTKLCATWFSCFYLSRILPLDSRASHWQGRMLDLWQLLQKLHCTKNSLQGLLWSTVDRHFL